MNLTEQKIINKFSTVTDMIKKSGVDKFFLAGGAIRDIYLGLEPKDYDLYFHSFDDSVKVFKFISIGFENPGKNLSRIGCNGFSLEIMHFRTFVSGSDLINSFDFTMCSACMDQDGNFFYHHNFIRDLEAKKLVINKMTYPVGTMERIARFAARGWTIDKPDIFQIALGINDMKKEDITLNEY